MARYTGAILAAALALLLAAGPAAAHQIKLYAWVEKGRLMGEGYTPGGGKIQNQPLEVYDANGRLIAAAKTDEQGAFSLALPRGPAPWKLVLKAGPGHLGQYQLSAAELAPAQGAPPQARPPEGLPLLRVAYGLAMIAALAGLGMLVRTWLRRRRRS
ncbi:MAG: hypothetical protein C4525_10170 [Desulfarculus sp.]|nr:MAG: hypothetical protein C4525_10170 [Desulfarculus sp.]